MKKQTREKLTAKEARAQKEFLKVLKVPKRKTKDSLVVGIVGLVGSGKSSVARTLAGKIGAAVIEGDAIRVALRKQGERLDNARKIGENVLMKVAERGGNVVLDSDFIDRTKRTGLADAVKKYRAKLLFVRIHADYDVMAGRIISAKYQNKPDDFFGGASTKWQGSGQSRGAVVKLREMWRRTPHHYKWNIKAFPGGKWILKKLPFALFAEIDTTDNKEWRRKVDAIARKMLKF